MKCSVALFPCIAPRKGYAHSLLAAICVSSGRDDDIKKWLPVAIFPIQELNLLFFVSPFSDRGIEKALQVNPEGQFHSP